LNQPQTIHLAIAYDQNYLNQFYALLTSVIEHNKSHRISLHCIATGLSDAQYENIRQYCAGRGTDIAFYHIDKEMAARFVLSNNWTMAVYYRLFFPFLIPQDIQRLLYIDTDTLVVNDLAPLYGQDISGYPVGAVYDNYVKKQPLIGIEAEGDYFNSGVLLIDIPAWKEQQISEKAFDYLLRYPERILFVDQCALNAVLKNNWKKLPGYCNTMTSMIPAGMDRKLRSRFLSDKIVLHFTLQRPWLYLCTHPYRHLYHHYVRQSPLSDKKPVKDFAAGKIKQKVKQDVLAFYLSSPVLKRTWQMLKNKKNS